MSEHGYPDFQRYAQWFGAPLVDATAFAIGAGSHTDGPLQVNNWSSVILYVKPTGGTIVATVRQTSSGIGSGLVSDTVVNVPAGSTVVRSVVLLGNQVSLILQGSAPGETVDYSLVPSNTAVNTGTVSNPTIGFQKGGALVGNEPILDFVDSGLLWTVADDGANTRVTVSVDPPPGVIWPYGGAAAPTGYVLCHGQQISRVTFAALFAIVGVTYGAGDGVTTFNVPDLQGRVPVGLGTNATVNARGLNDGVALANRRGELHRHTPHAHGPQVGGETYIMDGAGGLTRPVAGTTAVQRALTGTADGGSGTATDPLDGGAYLVTEYIIKT